MYVRQFYSEQILSIIAYAASVLEDTGNKEWVEMDKRWLNEQKEEFREMDEDHDGLLTKDELTVNGSFASFAQRFESPVR